MAPRNANDMAFVTSEGDELQLVHDVTTRNDVSKHPAQKIVWYNVIRLAILHAVALWGVFLLPRVKIATWIWTFFLYELSCLGITAGAHRLWSHRSYRAKTPLKIFLIALQTLAMQNDVIEWVRDHRVHHKYSESDADPHNAKRGFFFAHCGWLMMRKHPEVKVKGQQIDISDITSDAVCAFQRRYYRPLLVLIGLVFPAVVPYYFWDESLLYAYVVSSILRYVIALHVTWLVNSAAHMWGMRPYDTHISPAENLLVALGAAGEGFHNYHHTFPQDYSTSEFGWRFNLTTFFIDSCALIGQASHRKKMAPDLVAKRQQRTGDVTVKGLRHGGF